MPSVVLIAADTEPAGSGLVSLLIFLLIPVGMYFLLIRPQRKRQREQLALQQSVQVGDEVMTMSGIYGFVSAIEGDIAWLEVDDDVQIRVSRAAIQRTVDTAKGETAVPVDDGKGLPEQSSADGDN